MRIDLLPSESWDRLNERITGLWGAREGESVRVHAGLGAGLCELALGLAQIFSHKRTIAIVKGNSPAFDHVLPWFLKEAYQIQTGKIEDLQTPGAIEAWVAGLKKETALVMFVEDHPVTGETWDWETADRLLNEAKMFCLRASHSAFLSRPGETRPYSMRLCSLRENIAIGVFGARLKIPPFVSHRLAWSFEAVEEALKSRRAELARETDVLEFEKQFAAQRLFPEGHSRLYDRAVLAFTDVGGEALLRALGRRLKMETLFGAQMDTAHLCRWDSLRLYKGWWHQPPTDDQLRGLVTFSPSILERKDFAKELTAAYEEVKQLQTW